MFNFLEGGGLECLATKPRLNTHNQYLVGKFGQSVELRDGGARVDGNARDGIRRPNTLERVAE